MAPDDGDGDSTTERTTAGDQLTGDAERIDGHARDASDADDAAVGAAVVTISSTRTLEEDAVGDAIVAAFEDAGHDLATRELIRNGYDNVQSTVSRLIDRNDVDVVVTTGGTGVAAEDATLEAVESLLEKELRTFADLFTRVCYEEVGTGVLCARAIAGVTDGVAVFCLPDHVDATRVAAAEIVVPEAPSIVAQAAADEE